MPVALMFAFATTSSVLSLSTDVGGTASAFELLGEPHVALSSGVGVSPSLHGDAWWTSASVRANVGVIGVGGLQPAFQLNVAGGYLADLGPFELSIGGGLGYERSWLATPNTTRAPALQTFSLSEVYVVCVVPVVMLRLPLGEEWFVGVRGASPIGLWPVLLTSSTVVAEVGWRFHGL